MALDQLQKERIKKLNNLKRLGINPYPAKSSKKQSIAQVLKLMGKKVTVAGRLRSMRPHGKIAFADLEDASGKIQLLLRQNNVGDAYELLPNLDIGDFIETLGEVIKTQAGETTIDVTDFKVLTKSLRPLPSSWYGLKDVEERYRRRYVDMVMNPEVKKIMELRSKIIFSLRDFLINKKGYYEVENPVLQPLYGGTRARPFKTHHNSLDMSLFLRISNELYLKRLIVGGFEKVFEIGHTFRNEGMDRNHNPEFTMLETMEAYADYIDNMDLVEEMFEYVVKTVFGKTKLAYQGKEIEFKRPWVRVKLADLFKTHTGVNFDEIDTLEKATTLAKKLGVEIKDFMTDGEILLEIFEKKCTDQLVQPTFVYDYPADFYPLAKRKANNQKFVESFDIYVAGMEMGTNYSEQNDPQELKKAWEDEKKKLKKGNPEAQKTDDDFLTALEYGMPPTSGIGPGLDRWVMVMTDSPSIADVIPFPMLRPEKKIKLKEQVKVGEKTKAEIK
ncbi:lysine--tRNA ligase [Candidatus Daviesbacteria bacterium]|nr:lysine--tRNA ligase [Candidatus Daviesbacteria bacterium]